MQPPKGKRATTTSREQLVQAALDVILTKGIDAVRTEEICEKVGVTRGSLYWHFEGREDLVRAALTEQLRRLNEDIAGGIDTAINEATNRDDYLSHIAPVVLANFDPANNENRWAWLRLLIATHDDPALFPLMSDAQLISHRAFTEMMTSAKERGILHPAVDPAAMAMALRAITLGAVLFEFLGDEAPTRDEWFGLMLFLIGTLFPEEPASGS